MRATPRRLQHWDGFIEIGAFVPRKKIAPVSGDWILVKEPGNSRSDYGSLKMRQVRRIVAEYESGFAVALHPAPHRPGCSDDNLSDLA